MAYGPVRAAAGDVRKHRRVKDSESNRAHPCGTLPTMCDRPIRPIRLLPVGGDEPNIVGADGANAISRRGRTRHLPQFIIVKSLMAYMACSALNRAIASPRGMCYKIAHLMRIPLTVSACALLILMGAAVVGAADGRRGPTTRPSSQPTPSATLVRLSRLVEFRPSLYDSWQRAEEGKQIPFAGEIRLGPRSAVELQFAGTDRTIVLDRLGTYTIAKIWEQFRDRPDRIDSRVQYARTRYDIEETGVEHMSVLRSPSSTLAVRGQHPNVAPTTQSSFWSWLTQPPPDPLRSPAAAATTRPAADPAASHSAASTRPAR